MAAGVVLCNEITDACADIDRAFDDQIAAVGAIHWPCRDEDSAIDELNALQSQILEIGRKAQDHPSLAQLKQMSIQLSDIRQELFDITSHHKLGSMFFSSIQLDVDAVIDTEQDILTKIGHAR